MDNNELFRMIQQAIVESAEDVKRELRTEINGLRSEISDIRIEISDIRTEISDIRTEISDIRTEISDIRTEMNSLRTEMNTRFDRAIEDWDYLKAKVQEHDRDIYMLKRRT